MEVTSGLNSTLPFSRHRTSSARWPAADKADRAEWALFLARLARLVKPGGILLLGAVRRCNVYHVFEREFPTTYLDENDFAAELPRVGFPAKQTVIRVAEGVGWGEQGFDSVLCVRAVKGA